jgi:hypothetical protein
MKKVLLIIMITMLASCGNAMKIDKKLCDTYGMFDKEEKKCEGVEYRLIKRNAIPAIILSGSILVPVYIIGFDLYEPIGKKKNDAKN